MILETLLFLARKFMIAKGVREHGLYPSTTLPATPIQRVGIDASPISGRISGLL